MDFILFILIFLALLLILGLFILLRLIRHRHLSASLKQILLRIRLTKNIKNEEPKWEVEINESAQLFSLLSALKKPFTLEAAVPHIGEEIHFFLSVDATVKEAAIRQIHSLWPEAEVIPVSDFNIFNSTGVARGLIVKNKHHQAIPFRTFHEVGDDTFAPILSGLSKINEVGEGAAIQIVVEPISNDKIKKQLVKTISELRSGEDPGEVLSPGSNWLKTVDNLIAPQKTPAETDKKPIINEELIKAISEKIGKPLLNVNIRLLSSAPTSLQADSLLDGLMAGFNQLVAIERNEFKFIKPRRLTSLVYDFSFRLFNEKYATVLNSDELASIFHLPTLSANIPRVSWLKAKEANPPINLPATGVLLGESIFRGERRLVNLNDEDRRRHVYIIGQTGTGKSTLLTNMVISDIRRGRGVAIIDPHGDLVDTIAGLIPDERVNDVILFDPGDFEYPLGLNMLNFNPSRPEEKTFIVNEIQSIFNRLFPSETMGPMFEQYMRNALLLLMEDSAHEPATLIEVPRVFTDTEWRQAKLARIHNPSVIDFWEKEAIKAGGDASLANITPYITSKFNNFIANDYVRPIIGQTKSAFNFRDSIDTKKIILINLSKGRIGDLNAGLLGMLITGKILMAALSRVDIKSEERTDFNLYIDEFQNFTTDSIATILSEARKYKLNLTLAHQFIAQLTDDIRDSVFGNVGSLISFRVGATDAETLVKQFSPVFTENDLINIDNFNAYVRLLINGEPALPFNLKTLPSDYGDKGRGDLVRRYSRSRYAASRADVEQSILQRLRS